MQSFQYRIKDPLGIHFRSASGIVNEAKKYTSFITVNSNDKNAAATGMLSLMSLGIKCGDLVEVAIVGADEMIALNGMKGFFEKFL